MSLKLNNKEYTGFLATLISLLIIVFIGIVFLGITIIFTSPIWLPILIIKLL